MTSFSGAPQTTLLLEASSHASSILAVALSRRSSCTWGSLRYKACTLSEHFACLIKSIAWWQINCLMTYLGSNQSISAYAERRSSREYVVAVIKPRLVQVYLVHEAFGEEELEEILSSVRDNKELVKSSTFWSINQINDPSFVTKNHITFVQVISPKNFRSICTPSIRTMCHLFQCKGITSWELY